MSFLSQTVSIPLWLLIGMIAIMLPTLVKLVKLGYRIKQGELVKEEQGDTVIWKVQNRVRTAKPKKRSSGKNDDKEREKKAQLAQILKILLKEGEKGVLMKTIADRMEVSILDAQHAMKKLIDKNMAEEVVSVSGTRYYLTQVGKDYCRRKAR